MEEPKDIKSLLLRQQWEASFYQIVEQYSERLLYCAISILKSETQAQDALQEGMISIWKNLHRFEGKSHPFTWCYSIVRNAALTELKRENRHKSSDVDSLSHAAISPVDLKWDGDEISKKVQEVLAKLPEKQQMVFELRYYQDLSFKDISELTGTSTGALKANYHHAKIKMEENLIGLLNLP
ncbi:MAG: RNA polymerase subunit sigma-70 [Bacteroidetes bacterium]|jgi:RNA polymerase sigma-70 factor (ECF subfamily)|nr:MAG: RNA polymerase subunit sigma-70 [Bacteroidota bacterium]